MSVTVKQKGYFNPFWVISIALVIDKWFATEQLL